MCDCDKAARKGGKPMPDRKRQAKAKAAAAMKAKKPGAK